MPTMAYGIPMARQNNLAVEASKSAIVIIFKIIGRGMEGEIEKLLRKPILGGFSAH